MARAPDRACHRCGVAGCTDHKVEAKPWGSNSPETAKLYGSGKWKKLRLAILNRDAHLCQVCLERDVLTEANTVDHIAPRYKEKASFFNPNNLRAICKECHRTKTQQEAQEAKGHTAKPDFVV